MARHRWILLACLVVAGSAAYADEGDPPPEGKKHGKKHAQGGMPSQEELVQKRDAKLGEPWLKAAPWFTDYDKALAEAKKTGKPVLAFFSRSYAY